MAAVKETFGAIGNAFAGTYGKIFETAKNAVTFNRDPDAKPGVLSRAANWTGEKVGNNVKDGVKNTNNAVKWVFETKGVKEVAVITISFFALRSLYNGAKKLLGLQKEEKQNAGMQEELSRLKAENAQLAQAYQFNNEHAQGGHRDMVQNARGQQTAMGRGA